MSKDRIAEVDAQLADALPDDTDEISQKTIPDPRKREMIDLLKHAKQELGRSPTIRDFRSLGFETSGDVIADTFGTWNGAKRAAGLEIYEPGDKHPTTAINEEYFKDVDTPQKAYWLGTLVAVSSISDTDSLQIVRTNKPFFVKQFSQAIESEYAVNERRVTRGGTVKTEYETHICNSVFLDHLKSAGHPDGDHRSDDIPEISKPFRAPFTRGYLESSGYFTSGGWNITVDTQESAERLQGWFGSFGAKRPSIGEDRSRPIVRVSNAFDIKSVFETCWPDGVSTEPSYTPYPRKILDHLNSEYPYPENVDYLDGN